MNPLEAALRKAASDLDQRGCQWSIVGGFAVSARSNPRFTADIDIAAAVARDTQAEELVQSLIAAGYQFFAAAEAIRLITERGFDRDRDLAQLLAEMRRRPSVD
ncbi:hypothetical protein [Nocardia lasii]|uniref:Nucleotidyltransferase family protein n=1 Tax=Nocardia lasii TaxID=1616107 RepID=A0ABW1JV42_9NOCA